MINYYKEYENDCFQGCFDNKIICKNKSDYEATMKLLQSNNIKCKGYMNDWDCVFEIKYKLHD